MAQQAALKRATGPAVVPPPVTETNKGGRPKGSKTRPAEERAAEKVPKLKTFDYSRYKLTFQKPADFYAYMAGYPDRTGLCFYLFRLRPAIDHGLIGIDESSIAITSNEADMTEDAVAEVWGRGFYMVKVTDANRPKGQQELCRTWFDCELAPKAPVYDIRTLKLAVQTNGDEIQRHINLGTLVRDLHTQQVRLRNESDKPLASPSVAAGASGGPFNLDVNSLVASLIQRGATSGADHVKETIEVARMLNPQQGPIDMDVLADKVAARLSNKTATVAAEPNDMFSAYEKMERFINRVTGRAENHVAVPVTGEVLTGEGPAAVAAGGGSSSWAAHVPGILGEVKSLIPTMMDAYRELKSENGGGEGMQQRQQARAAAPATFEDRVEEILRLGFQRMNEGVGGFDYAAWLVKFQPDGAAMFRWFEGVGVAGLMGMLAMNARSRALVTGTQRPQIESFISEFLSFSIEEVADDEGEGEGPGASASPAA